MSEVASSQNILIVEDDRDFARSFADVLELHGYRVHLASTLAEARRCLAEESIAVVLCDMRLGQERGLDLLDDIKQQQLPCKYLIVTAYADTELVIEALQKGASDFLRKPLEIPLLLVSLKRCCEVFELERAKQEAEETTERHKRELEASNARLNLMIARMPLGCIVWDSDFRVTLWNPEAEQIFGYSETETVGRHPYELIVPPEVQPQVEDVFRQILEGDATAHSVNENITRDGRTIICEWHNTPMHDIEGKVSAVLSMVQEITEREQTEVALRASEERFRALFDTSPDGIIVSDLESGKIIDVNEVVLKRSGLGKSDFLERDSLEIGLWKAEERATMYRLLKEHGQVTNMEITYTRPKTNASVTGLLSARVVELGGQKRLMTVVRDVSELKEAEQALRESEDQYRRLYREFETLLNGIPDALVLLDPELMIVWANKGAEGHFGAKLGILPGKHCKDLWGLDAELCDHCIQKTFVEGVPQEKIHHAHDGRVWGMKAFPIKDASGAVVNVIQISSDLTEKVALREEASRASRLAALGEMAAGVAHEINNPNGMIMISLNMIDQAIKDGRPILERHFEEHGDFLWGGVKYSRMRSEIPRLIEEMREATQRIKHTVEELKGFSRRDLQSDYERLDLNTCVENALRLTEADWKDAGAEIFTDLLEGLPPVRGVRQRIEQILINLIGNACHALKEGNATIEVCSRIRPDGEQVAVSVRDHGIGIDPEHLERITDPFFTTRREVGGTGLGLSLSARMAKEHGGSLEFTSALGQGTTVTLVLPVSRENNA